MKKRCGAALNMNALYILLILAVFGAASCTKVESERRRTIPILLTPFYGFDNTPGLYDWKFSGDTTRHYPLVNIGPYPGNRWSLGLEADPSGGEFAWYDLDSLEQGEYEFRIYMRALATGTTIPAGRIVVKSASTSKEVFCAADTTWHDVEFSDTLPAGPAKLYLYGGVAEEKGAKVLFNEVYVAQRIRGEY